MRGQHHNHSVQKKKKEEMEKEKGGVTYRTSAWIYSAIFSVPWSGNQTMVKMRSSTPAWTRPPFPYQTCDNRGLWATTGKKKRRDK
jgi:hypothetical protein